MINVHYFPSFLDNDHEVLLNKFVTDVLLCDTHGEDEQSEIELSPVVAKELNKR